MLEEDKLLSGPWGDMPPMTKKEFEDSNIDSGLTIGELFTSIIRCWIASGVH